jgi:hypothetical protein
MRSSRARLQTHHRNSNTSRPDKRVLFPPPSQQSRKNQQRCVSRQRKRMARIKRKAMMERRRNRIHGCTSARRQRHASRCLAVTVSSPQNRRRSKTSQRPRPRPWLQQYNPALVLGQDLVRLRCLWICLRHRRVLDRKVQAQRSKVACWPQQSRVRILMQGKGGSSAELHHGQKVRRTACRR